MTSKKPTVGTICPLQCGQCCDFWQDVKELAADAAARPNALYCPHLGKGGCQLSRKHRPGACVEYMCGVAQAVVDGDITHDEGVHFKEHGAIDLPFPYKPRRRASR